MARHAAQLQRSSCLLLVLLALALLPSQVTAEGMMRRGLLGAPKTSKSLDAFSLGLTAQAGRTPSPAKPLGMASAPGPAPAAEAADAASPAPSPETEAIVASLALSPEAEIKSRAPPPTGLNKEQEQVGEQEVLAAEATARAALPEALTPLDPACASVPYSRYVRVSETLALQVRPVCLFIVLGCTEGAARELLSLYVGRRGKGAG